MEETLPPRCKVKVEERVNSAGRSRAGLGRGEGLLEVIITVKSGCWVSFPVQPNVLPLLLPRQKIYMCAVILGGGRGGTGRGGEFFFSSGQ